MPSPSPFATRVPSFFLAILSLCTVAFVTGCNVSGGNGDGNGGNGSGTPTKLVFMTSPNGGLGATAWTTQPVVAVEDSFGNTVIGSTASITLTITSGTGTSGAALSCTNTTVAASVGVATFAGCKINLAGSNYTLTASASGLTSGTSNSFNVAVGSATMLVFTTQPSGGTAATAWTTQPSVTVEDAGGNTVASSSASITLAITSGTGTSGAALSCTNNTVSANSGVATFAGCKINLAGSGYTLTASATGLGGASSAFTISAGAATQLSFTVEPQTALVSSNMASIAVAVKDGQGNTVTGSTASVALAITGGTGTAGAVLACSGGTTQAAGSGVATFTNCQVNMAGTNYTLTASSSGLTNGVSTAFNISSSVGGASKLSFSASPSGGSGAAVWTTQPVVHVEDSSGNTITSGAGSNASITLTITGGTGATGAALTCTSNMISASSGVASFAGCQINLANGGYTLTAAASGLTSATSNTFSITVGAATKLAFTTQPGGGTGGTSWAQQPAVTVQDAGGNTVTTSSAITLAIAPGIVSGTLTCTAANNTLNASAGVATFTGCKINVMGTDLALTASSSGLATATSAAFDIAVGPATRLFFGTMPGGTLLGSPLSVQPVVQIKDAGGDNVTTGAASSAMVTLGISSGTGPAGAVLTCTGGNTVTAVSGIATFSGCQLSLAGPAYTLVATSSGLTNALSAPVVVETTAGSPARLAFTVQPTNTEVNVPMNSAVQVTIQDANGVPVASATNQVTLAPLNNPGGATVGGTTQINASGGVASFTGLTLSAAGNADTLQATSSGLASANSNGFNVFNGLAPTCSGAPNGSEYLMTGHWAALVQGWTGNGAGEPLHMVFAISTDGMGGLTNLDSAGGGGQLDRQNGGGGASSYLNATILDAGSSYVIGQDPTSSGYVGCMTLALSGGGTVHFRFTLGGITGTSNSARASKAAITRWDDPSGTGGRGTGVLLPQDSSKFSIASMSANFAFGLRGLDQSGAPFSEAGATTLNTSTGALNFQFDYDDAGSGGLTTGTGTVSQITNETAQTGRLTVSSTVSGSATGNNAVWYIVNNNEFFDLSADPYTTSPIASGRGIVTTHGSVAGISGNFMIHMTGTSTVSSGGGCLQNNVLVDCADVNLVAVTATSTGAQTASISGYSWEYVQGNTVTPNAISGVTGTVDPTWGRLVLSGTSVQQAPVFYLATPQTGADATEPYLALGAGSGTAGNIDPSALSGFMEAGVSTNVTQSAVAGKYFFYTEMPSDNFVGTGVGVVILSSSGGITGTRYAQEGSQGLQIGGLSGTVTVTNADPVVSSDTFPGLANTGPGTFGILNGKRFIFFDTGVKNYTSPGTNGAEFFVVDQQ